MSRRWSLCLSLWYFFFAISCSLETQIGKHPQRISLNVSKDSTFYFFDYCIDATYA